MHQHREGSQRGVSLHRCAWDPVHPDCPVTAFWPWSDLGCRKKSILLLTILLLPSQAPPDREPSCHQSDGRPEERCRGGSQARGQMDVAVLAPATCCLVPLSCCGPGGRLLGRGEVEESGKQKKRKKSEPTGVGTTGLYSKINVTGCGWAGQGFAT